VFTHSHSLTLSFSHSLTLSLSLSLSHSLVFRIFLYNTTLSLAIQMKIFIPSSTTFITGWVFSGPTVGTNNAYEYPRDFKTFATSGGLGPACVSRLLATSGGLGPACVSRLPQPWCTEGSNQILAAPRSVPLCQAAYLAPAANSCSAGFPFKVEIFPGRWFLSPQPLLPPLLHPPSPLLTLHPSTLLRVLSLTRLTLLPLPSSSLLSPSSSVPPPSSLLSPPSLLHPLLLPPSSLIPSTLTPPIPHTQERSCSRRLLTNKIRCVCKIHSFIHSFIHTWLRRESPA